MSLLDPNQQAPDALLGIASQQEGIQLIVQLDASISKGAPPTEVYSIDGCPSAKRVDAVTSLVPIARHPTGIRPPTGF